MLNYSYMDTGSEQWAWGNNADIFEGYSLLQKDFGKYALEGRLTK